MSIDKQFEEIARATLSAVDDVACSKEEYRVGLRQIIEELELALDAASYGDDE